MKHILVPTDFSIKSLNVINNVIAKYGNQPLKITLLHLLSMPASITELLLLRRSKIRYEDKVSPEFYDACHVLQNRYADKVSVMDIRIEFGDSIKFMNTYLEANEVDKVVMAIDIRWQHCFKESIDLLSLLTKTKAEIDYVTAQAEEKNHMDVSVISMNSLKNVKQLKEELSYATEE